MVAFVKSHPVRDVAGRREWEVRHNWCQSCGVSKDRAPWPGLSTHHVVRQGRSDEKTNWLRLCHRCHQRAEGLTVRVNGVVLPKLTLANCLYLKRHHDPEEFDERRLAELYHQALPIPESPF